MTETRVPAGVPAGGQFATQPHAEADLALDGSPDLDDSLAPVDIDAVRTGWTRIVEFRHEQHEHAAFGEHVAVVGNLIEAIDDDPEPMVGYAGQHTRVYEGTVAFRTEPAPAESMVVVTSPAGERYLFCHTAGTGPTVPGLAPADPWAASQPTDPAYGRFFAYDPAAPDKVGAPVTDTSRLLDGLDWHDFDADVDRAEPLDLDVEMWRVARTTDGRPTALVVVGVVGCDLGT